MQSFKQYLKEEKLKYTNFDLDPISKSELSCSDSVLCLFGIESEELKDTRSMSEIDKIFRKHGYKVEDVGPKKLHKKKETGNSLFAQITVREFLEDVVEPNKDYVVATNKHVIGIKDGRIVDTAGITGKSKVELAFEVQSP